MLNGINNYQTSNYYSGNVSPTNSQSKSQSMMASQISKMGDEMYDRGEIDLTEKWLLWSYTRVPANGDLSSSETVESTKPISIVKIIDKQIELQGDASADRLIKLRSKVLEYLSK